MRGRALMTNEPSNTAGDGKTTMKHSLTLRVAVGLAVLSGSLGGGLFREATTEAAGPVTDQQTLTQVVAELQVATVGFHGWRYGYRSYGFYGYGYSYARPQLYVGARYPAYGYGWSTYRPYVYAGPAVTSFYAPYGYTRSYYRPYYASPYVGAPYAVSPYAYPAATYVSPYYARPYYTYPQGHYRYGYYAYPSYAAFAYPYGYSRSLMYRGPVIYGF